MYENQIPSPSTSQRRRKIIFILSLGVLAVACVGSCGWIWWRVRQRLSDPQAMATLARVQAEARAEKEAAAAADPQISFIKIEPSPGASPR